MALSRARTRLWTVRRQPFPYWIMEGLPVIPPELPVSIHGTAVATILDFPAEAPERRV